MEKRYWIGFALILLIVLGAFCVPWLLLHWEQQRAEKLVLTVTEDVQLSASQLTLLEKQQFLSGDDFVILQETEPDGEESDRLTDSALQELEMLRRSGALDDLSHSMAVSGGESMQVRLCVAFTDTAVLRFYILGDATSTVRLYLDVETEKILCITLAEAWEQGEEMRILCEATKSAHSTYAWEEMEAWALYYGLVLGDVSLVQEDDGIIRQEGLLIDEDGQRVVFCKLYNSENGDMGWRSVQKMNIEESVIQFGGEEDANSG